MHLLIQKHYYTLDWLLDLQSYHPASGEMAGSCMYPWLLQTVYAFALQLIQLICIHHYIYIYKQASMDCDTLRTWSTEGTQLHQFAYLGQL